jgi:mannose-6-phosphate isomerase
MTLADTNLASEVRDYSPYIENRPWGHFERFTLNEACTVKLVYVEEGRRLSLQYHRNRTEFWKVVEGPVQVELNGKQRVLNRGETMIIPKGTIHRMTGIIGIPEAVVLEISFGNFDENDIERLEDDFKR